MTKITPASGFAPGAALPTAGGIDCDLHPAVPDTDALLPYLDEYWRSMIVMRGINRLSLAMTGRPENAPANRRPDWAPETGRAGADLDRLRRDALDAFGTRAAICNPLYGPQIMHSDDMAAVLCRAMNDWQRDTLLDPEPRLFGSIVVSAQNAELAVEEIERAAADPRFVQVLLLLMNDEPLGRRRYWPIFAAAERLKLPVTIHAGGAYRHAPTATGWPGSFVEDYIAQAAIAENTLLSLIAEGVLTRFPDLKLVFAETGFMWVPSFYWRADKTWRGTRAETPWLTEPPSVLMKRQVRFTIQPVDMPAEGDEALQKTLRHIDCDDLLLFSTDYPHWQFDGTAALPAAFGAALGRRILVDNPLATYPRLAAALAEEDRS